jgi:hypothetical protein
MTTDPVLVPTAEAARALGVTRRRVIELAAAEPDFPPGQALPTGGHSWPRAAIERWAAAHPDRGPRHPGDDPPRAGRLPRDLLKVLQLAAAEAGALHRRQAEPEHLLLALARPDCPGAAEAVLASFGVTVDLLRAAHRDPGPPAGPGELGGGLVSPSQAVRSLLERAQLEAVLLADAEPSGEHALLALAARQAEHGGSVGVSGHRADPADVRKWVLDVTEGVALPAPPPPRPEGVPSRSESLARIAADLDLAPTPDGGDPRQRWPWESLVFFGADGKPFPLGRTRQVQQYFIDRDGNPVLTTDGRAVHLLKDGEGHAVRSEDGALVFIAVGIPPGSSVRTFRRS